MHLVDLVDWEDLARELYDEDTSLTGWRWYYSTNKPDGELTRVLLPIIPGIVFNTAARGASGTLPR